MPNASHAPVLAAKNLSKSFGSNHANDAVSLELKAGRVHAVLGENGAGKSTLIGQLTGSIRPESGQMFLDGQAIQFLSPASALEHGISAVYQRANLVNEFSIVENLRMLSRGAQLNFDVFAQTLQSLYGRSLDLKTIVGSLDLGTRYLVETARAVAQHPRVLILDEPTALITTANSQRLTQLLKELTHAGTAVAIVTHKLGEALEVADDVTVMRAGRVVMQEDATVILSQGAEGAHARLLKAMFGESPRDAERGDEQRKDGLTSQTTQAYAEPTLALESLHSVSDIGQNAVRDLSLTVSSGEVVAIAGVLDNGQSTLVRLIAGLERPASGTISVNGHVVTDEDVHTRKKLGIRTISDDRFNAELVPTMSIALNALLERVGDRLFWRGIFTNTKAIHEHAETLAAVHDIHFGEVHDVAGTLSGGNAQKLILSRGSTVHPLVTVLEQPTQGLDAKTVLAVHQQIRSDATEGQAVLLISADLDEIEALADRVLVLSSGRIVAEIEGHRKAMRDEIARAMSGITGANS